MRRTIISVVLAVVGVAGLASSAPGQATSADEQAFLKQHLADVVTVVPTRLDDPDVVKTFSGPIYQITITINMGDNSTSHQQQIAARVGDKLVPLSQPSTDRDCSDIQKMLNGDFTLRTDDDAKVLQSALDELYPVASDDDKKVVAFHHDGHEWSFVRGAFFDKHLGFIFTTDDGGKITDVKFSLKLP